MEMARDYKKAQGEERETLQTIAADKVQDIAWKDPKKADPFYRVVTGKSVPTAHHLEAWLNSLENESKTLF